MTLYLLKYNNYYNRVIKRWNTSQDILNQEETVLVDAFENVNFNPRDGVVTDITLNYDGPETANYLVVEDPTDGSTSGWFIIDANYIRLGQYHLTLRRDLVNDLWESFSISPSFIEKATLATDNPLFFNRENMAFNQIKTKETLLKDTSGVPWIVGYLAPNAGTTISIPIPGYEPDYDLADLGEYTHIDWVRSSGYENGLVLPIAYNLEINGFAHVLSILEPYPRYCFSWDENGNSANYDTSGDYSRQAEYVYKHGSGQTGFQMVWDALSTIGSFSIIGAFIKKHTWSNIALNAYISEATGTTSDLATLDREVGKIVKVGGDYYKIVKNPKSQTFKRGNIPQGSALGTKMSQVSLDMYNFGYFLDSTVTQANREPAYQICAKCDEYTLAFEPLVQSHEYKMEIRGGRVHSKTPYNVFAIPYGEVRFNNGRKTDKEMAYKLASALIKQLQSSQLYDIQLLPFSPLSNSQYSIDASTGYWTIGGTEDTETVTGDRVTLRYKDDVLSGGPSVLFWIENPDFSLQIQANKKDKTLQVPADNLEAKIEYETSFHRICSPNYNGQFEFSAIKNGGVQSFDIDCSYKPFQPYIRISPSFGGLYGQDFNDARGLILGGDFSLPQIDTEWREYQIQNKNYQVMFDRQIENIDVNNKIQRTMEAWNIGAGAVSATATGAMGGSSMGPVGGFVGGFVGGVASFAGGIADRALAEQARAEARDYTIDQFGYQLGNIQARPANLTKVSSFNPNNKIFPVLEYYTATQEEKEALRQKLIYNGMTTMAIGYVNNYLQPERSYIKGRIVRFADDKEDFHIVNELANEFY